MKYIGKYHSACECIQLKIILIHAGTLILYHLKPLLKENPTKFI